MLSVSDVSEQKLYERLNQFNLANYISMPRIKDMSGNVLWTTMCVLAMIVFVVGVLCVYIKRWIYLKKLGGCETDYMLCQLHRCNK